MVIPFVVFPVMGDAYEFPKILLFKISVCFLLGLRLFALKTWNDVFCWVKSFFTEQRRWPIILLCLFFVAQSISVIWGIDSSRSFWGSPERWWGLTTQISFLLFLLLSFDIFEKKEDKEKFLFVFSCSAFFLSSYAIIQWLGLTDDTFIYTAGYVFPRPDATLGHPNYLGAYLAMTLPILYYLFIVTKKVSIKALLVLIGVVQLVALHNTINRGGYLAAFVSSVFFFVYYFWKISLEKNRILKIVTTVVGAGLILSFFWNGIFLPKGQAPKDRGVSEGSMLLRMIDMGRAVDFIKKKPLIGYGAENYLLLSMSKKPEAAELLLDNHSSDRVHNWLFDNLVVFGFLGTIVLFVFWLLVLKKSIYDLIFDNRHNKMVALLALAVWGAYGVVVQFHFDTYISSFVIYSFLALVLSGGRQPEYSENKIELSILILAILPFCFCLFLAINCLF